MSEARSEAGLAIQAQGVMQTGKGGRGGGQRTHNKKGGVFRKIDPCRDISVRGFTRPFYSLSLSLCPLFEGKKHGYEKPCKGGVLSHRPLCFFSSYPGALLQLAPCVR